MVNSIAINRMIQINPLYYKYFMLLAFPHRTFLNLKYDHCNYKINRSFQLQNLNSDARVFILLP